MVREGLPAPAIASFRNHYEALHSGATGLISGAEIAPVDDLESAAALPAPRGEENALLGRCAAIKLNGGLGTSMGMTRAKSLLPVRDDRSFLDIIVGQVLHARRNRARALPLLFMNSYRTRDDTSAKLADYPELAEGQEVPLDFLQHKVPRIDAQSLAPYRWAEDPEAEWCPPGHGDLYPALRSSGALSALRGCGIDYAFVSNADNLGAVLDQRILSWFSRSGAAFAMEVCERLPADRKGGHLARTRAGGLVLRESAQCPDDEIEDFQDITRYRYFNTNNLWIDLGRLADALERHGGFLPLPMIRNRKQVNGTAVYQLESAMGAAIGCFEDARALLVPRERFAPVKTVGDLLLVRSDAYELSDDARLLPVASPLPDVDLDPAIFADLSSLDRHFPHGPPSLRGCRRFRVRGPVRFGAEVVCRADVDLSVAEETAIPDGAILGA
jgi:UTP--glucose-1-phosphate uridylyltransferase